MSAYQTDFYLWTQQQAQLLRQGDWLALDREYLAEELDDMGASQVRELESRLGVLFAHLLKWMLQPERRGHSWRLTIKEQRRRIQRLLLKNPSLQAKLSEISTDAYGDAVLIAAREMNQSEDVLPVTMPFTLAQALDAWWPQ